MLILLGYIGNTNLSTSGPLNFQNTYPSNKNSNVHPQIENLLCYIDILDNDTDAWITDNSRTILSPSSQTITNLTIPSLTITDFTNSNGQKISPIDNTKYVGYNGGIQPQSPNDDIIYALRKGELYPMDGIDFGCSFTINSSEFFHTILQFVCSKTEEHFG
ncbi:MAG: hypothetical protein Ta2E_00700 [Mycoplasmoidaceae bacterium]|nr:MAG: hypothetical protein Ta2E_00700 [Mycoplasmoidaceae bacterium]